MFKKLLVPIDGSPPAWRALEVAARMAGRDGAELAVVTVPHSFIREEPDEGQGDAFDAVRQWQKDRAREKLDAAAARLAATGIRFTTAIIEADEPYEGIMRAAQDAAADLIVMGSHGRRGINRLLLGSQATKVVAMSDVPVLICKGPPQGDFHDG